jgi:hypothetical protein
VSQDEVPQQSDEKQGPEDQEPPELAPITERSLELPAVIIGDRGSEEERPEVRVLPGRLPESTVLYPAYTLVGAAALLTTHYSLNSGEWSPLMTFFGWGLLFCWYWVYGVAYRYRRRMMKYFSLIMCVFTAGTLSVATAVRSTSMAVPVDGGLVVREAQPILFGAAALTTVSLTLIIAHVVYIGRGYRQKRLDSENEGHLQ